MAEKKFLDANGLKIVKEDYEAKDAKKVDKEEGKSLVLDTEITKLSGVEAGAQKNNITKVQVNGSDQTISDDGTLNLDIEAVIGEEFIKPDDLTEQLTPYLKSTDADGKFATKDDVTNLGTILGTCEAADLETKKTESGVGDCWVVTDDSNHIYYYNGTDFIDTGNDIDIELYLEKTEAESTYAKQTALTEGLAGKADKSDLNAKANTTDLPTALEQEEIEAILNPVV